ncbi:MAG: methyl-accepting chemotaxis protein [Phycisphaerales bacterium]|nr:methyl-accepting chemotaxis protein [Planctomycetota bacterium]
MQKPSLFNSLSGRLLLLGVIPALVVIAGIVAWSAIDGYRSVRAAEEKVLGGAVSGAAAELNVRNEGWNLVAAIMAGAQESGLFGKRNDSSLFTRRVNASTTGIVSAFIVYEPNADGNDAASMKDASAARDAMDASGRFGPNWFNLDASGSGTDKLRFTPGAETMEFYQSPKKEFAASKKAAAFVSEPRQDENRFVVSHVFPIVIDGKFAGIAGVDRSLERLTEVANEIRTRSGADVFILSSGGRLLVAPGKKGQDGETRLSSSPVAETPYKEIAARWQAVTAGGEADVFEAMDPVLGEQCFYGVERTKIGGWTVVARRTLADAMREENYSIARNLVIGVLGMIVVAGLMFTVSRGIASRVRTAAQAADRIARGDLTEAIAETENRDETGQLMGSMRTMDSNLNSLVGNVKQAGIRLNSTATEIAATSKQQEASSATFGAASNQIAAAVKEISATGQDLVRTMESVSRMAAESASLATTGRAGLQSMEGVMRDLDGATSSIADKLNAINDRSQKITTVITTITKVADQTNILSINAAIEAEKAGEYGSGFLVIAREIRRLADQTASATLDIEQMVRQMQAAVSAGVMEMDRFADQVRRGVRDVVSAGSQMTEIIDRVNRSTDSFKQVNESMQAQSEGAKQISEAMGSLVSNANQTVQSAKEFGRAAGDLQAAIALLRDAVAKFKLRENA